jgi:hypothetical protein
MSQFDKLFVVVSRRKRKSRREHHPGKWKRKIKEKESDKETDGKVFR